MCAAAAAATVNRLRLHVRKPCLVRGRVDEHYDHDNDTGVHTHFTRSVRSMVLRTVNDIVNEY